MIFGILLLCSTTYIHSKWKYTNYSGFWQTPTDLNEVHTKIITMKAQCSKNGKKFNNNVCTSGCCTITSKAKTNIFLTFFIHSAAGPFRTCSGQVYYKTLKKRCTPTPPPPKIALFADFRALWKVTIMMELISMMMITELSMGMRQIKGPGWHTWSLEIRSFVVEHW